MTDRLERLATLRDIERCAGLRALAAATHRAAGLDTTQSRLAALVADIPTLDSTLARKAGVATRATLDAAARRVTVAQEQALAARHAAANYVARLTARADAVEAAMARAQTAATVSRAARR